MSDKQIEDLVDLMFDTDMEEVMKEKSTLEYIYKLQQENKQLKDLCNKYEEEHKTTFETWLKGQKVLTELEEWLNKEKGYYLYGKNNRKTLLYGKELKRIETIEKIKELKEKYK